MLAPNRGLTCAPLERCVCWGAIFMTPTAASQKRRDNSTVAPPPPRHSSPCPACAHFALNQSPASTRALCTNTLMGFLRCLPPPRMTETGKPCGSFSRRRRWLQRRRRIYWRSVGDLGRNNALRRIGRARRHCQVCAFIECGYSGIHHNHATVSTHLQDPTVYP